MNLYSLVGLIHRWWAPSKFDPVQSPMLFFENGVPVIPPIPPPLGMDKALKFMVWMLVACNFCSGISQLMYANEFVVL